MQVQGKGLNITFGEVKETLFEQGHLPLNPRDRHPEAKSTDVVELTQGGRVDGVFKDDILMRFVRRFKRT